ncbi:hypothetical protein NUM3379_25370 [Kineococcus sp. NUM-3379]
MVSSISAPLAAGSAVTVYSGAGGAGLPTAGAAAHSGAASNEKAANVVNARGAGMHVLLDIMATRQVRTPPGRDGSAATCFRPGGRL